jgi:hypothetical protein
MPELVETPPHPGPLPARGEREFAVPAASADPSTLKTA